MNRSSRSTSTVALSTSRRMTAQFSFEKSEEQLSWSVQQLMKSFRPRKGTRAHKRIKAVRTELILYVG